MNTFSYQKDIEYSKDIELIFYRMLDQLPVRYNFEELSEWAQKYNIETGLFEDIKYPTKYPIPDNQEPILLEHLDRLRAFAAASYDLALSDIELKKEYEEIAFSGACSFVAKNYDMHNWYYEQIGQPSKLKDILIWLDKMDSSGKMDAWKSMLKNLHGDSHAYSIPKDELSTSGANTADKAYNESVYTIAMIRQCLKTGEDYSMYDSWMKEVNNAYISLIEFVDRGNEGIQVDYSFSQHNKSHDGYPGTQLYTNHYGQNFISHLVSGNVFLIETCYGLDAQNLNRMVDVLIEGYGVMGYYNWLDYNAEGRCSTYGTIGFDKDIRPSINLLSSFDLDRKEELNELKRRCNGDESNNQFYKGNFHFYCTDYHATFFGNLFCGLKTVSNRTLGSESGNGEGLKNYFMGQGTHFFVRNGKEYYDIQPIWDWKKLPGTTVEQNNNALPQISWGSNSWGTDDRAGGVAQGDLGTSSMVWSRQNVKGIHKSHFFFKNSMVVMGYYIDIEECVDAVVSTVEQCKYQDEVQIILKGDSNEIIILEKDQQYESVDILQVTHNGIVYSFDESSINQKIMVQVIKQSGNWNEITDTKEGEEEDYVMTIYITHTDAESKALFYKVSSAENEKDDIDVNKFKGMIHLSQITSKRESAFTVFGPDKGWIDVCDTKISFNNAATGVTKWLDDNSIQFTVADLQQKCEKIDMKISGKWTNDIGFESSYSSSSDITTLHLMLPYENNTKGKAIDFIITKAIKRDSKVVKSF